MATWTQWTIWFYIYVYNIVWILLCYLIVSFSAEKLYDDINNGKYFNAFVTHAGEVVYTTGGTIVTRCNLNLKNFPSDLQHCYIKISNWAYNANHMSLLKDSSEVDLSRYSKNGLWKIVNSKVAKEVEEFEGIDYETIVFSFDLKRKSKYFVFNLFAPCLVLSLVGLLMFCMPQESGAKVSVGITVLLSFTVFQFVILERMPETSDYIPVAGLYASYIGL